MATVITAEQEGRCRERRKVYEAIGFVNRICSILTPFSYCSPDVFRPMHATERETETGFSYAKLTGLFTNGNVN